MPPYTFLGLRPLLKKTKPKKLRNDIIPMINLLTLIPIDTCIRKEEPKTIPPPPPKARLIKHRFLTNQKFHFVTYPSTLLTPTSILCRSKRNVNQVRRPSLFLVWQQIWASLAINIRFFLVKLYIFLQRLD
jgi:hypothetical protein